MALKRMAAEYLDLDWHTPQELYMCGRYASDAYFIFCQGRWREMILDPPADKDLKRYFDFLVATEGQGTGQEREKEEDLLQFVPAPQPTNSHQPASPGQPPSQQEQPTMTSQSTPEERRARLKLLLSSTQRSRITLEQLPAAEDLTMLPQA